jgi:parallel beta-helix repeat protein
VNDYIDCGSDGSLNLSNAFSIAAWIYPEDLPNDHKIILVKSYVASGDKSLRSYELGTYGTNVNVRVSNGTSITSSGGAVSLNTWSHVVGVFNGTSTAIYVDGSLKDSDSFSGTLNTVTYPVKIGRDQGDYYHWNGTIDDVLIFNRSLSAEEINASYNASNYRLFRNFTNLTDKTYNYIAYTQDEDGNVNQTTRSVTIDVLAPVITINSPLNVNYTSPPNLNVNFNQIVNKSRYSVNDGPNTTLCNGCSSANSVINHEYENTTNISGWWHFNDGSGNNTLDESDYENNGTCYNMNVDNTSCTWVEGKFGYGIEFDGDDDYIELVNDGSLNLTNAFTIAAWVYPEDLPSAHKIILGKSYVAHGDKSLRSYEFSTYGTNAFLRVSDGTSIISSGGAVSLNTWSHIVGVFNGTDTAIYIDGSLKDSDSFSGTLNTVAYSVKIGKDHGDYYHWNGTLDEVRILNKSLTATEVLEEYELSKGDHNITIFANNTFGSLSSANQSFSIVTIDENCSNLTGDTYGDWNNTLDVTCSDMEITRYGNTLIHNGGSLTLQNVTFKIISINDTREFYNLQSEDINLVINVSKIFSWNPNTNSSPSILDDVRAYLDIDGGNINITHSNISYLGNYSTNNRSSANRKTTNTPSGIDIQNVNYSVIYNNTFSNNFYGIQFTNSHDTNFSNNSLMDNEHHGIKISGCNYNYIGGNNFTNHSYYGARVDDICFNTTISDNIFSDSLWAHIELYNNIDLVSIDNNTFDTSDVGIEIGYGCYNLFIEDNIFRNITYSSDSWNSGIMVRDTINASITNNNLTQIGSWGIYLQNSTNVTISGNYIGMYSLSEKGNTLVDDINDPPTGIHISPIQKRWCPRAAAFDCTCDDDIRRWVSYNVTIENNTFGPNVQVLLRTVGGENITHDISSGSYWYVATQLTNWTDKDEMYIGISYSNLTNWKKNPDREDTLLYENFIYGGWPNNISNVNFYKIISRTKLNFSNSETYSPEPFRLYSPKWLLFNGSETELTIYQNYTYILMNNDSSWYETMATTINPHNDSEINLTVNQYNSSIINFTAVNTTADQTMNIIVENGTFNVTDKAWYRITKDSTQIATAQANSNNNITFLNIAVGSEYIIESTSAPVTTESPGGGGGTGPQPISIITPTEPSPAKETIEETLEETPSVAEEPLIEKELPSLEEPRRPAFFQRVKNFIKTIWNEIINFFQKLLHRP